MEGKQKISYAVSRGVPKAYTQEQKDLFFHSIEDIDHISVREQSLKEFIEENSDKEASVVLDPVMLHSKEFWHRISVKPEERGYVLLYYVMEQAADTIERAVEYADCIFTNSFHGCCYSILFEKLFYVGSRDGDKVTNILEIFGLQQLRMSKKGCVGGPFGLTRIH